MTIEPLLGYYVAAQRDPRGGGYVAKGTTHATAIIALLRVMRAHGVDTGIIYPTPCK